MSEWCIQLWSDFESSTEWRKVNFQECGYYWPPLPDDRTDLEEIKDWISDFNAFHTFTQVRLMFDDGRVFYET